MRRTTTIFDSNNEQHTTNPHIMLAEIIRLREMLADFREYNLLYLNCIHASHFRDKPGSAMSKLNQARLDQQKEMNE